MNNTTVYINNWQRFLEDNRKKVDSWHPNRYFQGNKVFRMKIENNVRYSKMLINASKR